MHFSQRVKEAIQGSGKTQSALAREVGVSQSAIAQWISGNVKSLKAETAAALELATGFNARWIVTGEGEKRVAQGGAELDSGWTVPLLAWSQATLFTTYESMAEADVEGWVGCPIPHSSDTFALRVQGASMHNPTGEASLTEGELIYVDPARAPNHGSLVVIRAQRDEQAYCRQLLVDGGTRYLQALNPNWPNRITQMAPDSSICGVVIGRLTEFPS